MYTTRAGTQGYNQRENGSVTPQIFSRQDNLLGIGCGRLREHGLLVGDSGLLARVEVLLQVDQAALPADQAQNLGLPIHHVFILQYLLDCYQFARLFPLSLERTNRVRRATRVAGQPKKADFDFCRLTLARYLP